MVIKKRLDYGINNFWFPAVPKAPRSVRRRNLHKKTVEDSQICAFELLASIAGKLLHESDSSSASSSASGGKGEPAFGKDAIKQEQLDESKALEAERIDQGCGEDSVYVSQPAFHNCDTNFIMKGLPNVEVDANFEGASVITNPDYLAKTVSGGKSLICESKSTAVGNFFSKVDGGSPDYGESCVSILENGIERAKGETTGGLTIASKCELKNPVELHMEFRNSQSEVIVPLCRAPVPNASFSRHRNDVNLDSKDDDENFSRRYKPNRSTKPKSSRLPSRLGDRRIRKLLMSKYWKVAPKLNDCEQSNADGAEPRYFKRKASYQGERCKREMFNKRRKLFNRSTVVTYDRGFNSESVSNSPPKKGMNRSKSGSTAKLRRGSAVSRSLLGPYHNSSFNSKDSNVKLSIKSISVPEFFIEFPETATIGLLKRTVMEAVTTILGDGLRVGVILRGKKIRDDNTTLLQTGISSKDNLDALGFTLEPSPVQASPLMSSKSSLPCDALQHSIGPPATYVKDSDVSDALADIPSPSNLGNLVNSNHELVSSDTDILTDEKLPNSRALVAVPAMSVEALAVVPGDQKLMQSELVQRRTRRPFSVSEVEALVYAVEDIGTGRWRDVKLRAFENADHRTYVDLKDKWKTLVHTAKISPQQRRGEPVPQELLDRVMAAHSYWTQQQANQPSKHQAETPNITDTEDDKFGVETGM